ncbi:LuxR C-terminal-related transcriptional regulator [Kitasatospora sp. NPDC004240]
MLSAESQETEDLLVGRDTETARLAAVVSAMEYKQRAVVEIAGDPGIGKTRLMTILSELARRRGAGIARAHAVRGNTTPYQVFHEAFGDDTGPLPDTLDEDDLFAAIRARLSRWAAVDGGGVLLLDDVHHCDEPSARLLARLIRTPAPGPLVLALAHSPRRTGSVLLEALDHGTRTGTVVRIEPKPLSTEAVAALLERWQGPEPGRTPGLRGCLSLREEDLSPPPGPLPDPDPEAHAFAERFREASAGNPRHLRILTAAGWHPDLWPDRPGTDPGGLLREAAPVAAELDALTDEARRAVGAIAALGDPFRADDAAEVTGLRLEQVLDVLADLVRADVVRPAGPGGRFAFRHPLLRHVAHERANVAVLLTAHRRALELLLRRGASATELARHAEHVVGTDGAIAVELLARGAAEILPDAPATAVRWLHLALEAMPSGDRPTPERAVLMLEYSRALIAAGRFKEARAAAHEVLRDDSRLTAELRLRACTTRVAAERQLGRYDEAEAVARAALTALPEPLPAGPVGLVFEYGLLHLLRGTYHQARALVREAVRASAGPGHTPAADPSVRPAGPAAGGGPGGVSGSRAGGGEADLEATTAIRVLAAFGDSYLGDTCAAVPALTACVRLVDGLPDPSVARTPELLTMLGWTELFLERLPDASRHLRRSLALAQGGGPQQMVPHALLALSYIDQEAGRLARSEQWALEAERAARTTGARDWVSVCSATRVGALIWSRGRDEAADVVALAEESVRTTRADNSWWTGSAAMQLAQAQLLGGDASGCMDTLLEAGGGAHLPLFQPGFRPMLLAMLATAALRCDHPDAARRWVEEADDAADRMGLAVQRAHADRALAVLHAADERHDVAAKLYDRAALGFRRAGRPVQHAWTLILGTPSAETTLGRAAADGWLESAEHLGRLHGAVRIQEEAAELRRSLDGTRCAEDGGRRSVIALRPDVTAVTAQLTTRERQIAELATAGLRSRAIADELFLSTRTVDTHLARVYRKLNVPSRTALTRLLLGVDDAESA